MQQNSGAVPLSHQQLGAYGEELAHDYLVERGYRVLARNWRVREGEIDIVALDGETVVAVEVKTRRGDGYGAPLESVTPQKVRRLYTLITLWCSRNQKQSSPVRIDAVGVLLSRAEPRVHLVTGVS